MLTIKCMSCIVHMLACVCACLLYEQAHVSVHMNMFYCVHVCNIVQVCIFLCIHVIVRSWYCGPIIVQVITLLCTFVYIYYIHVYRQELFLYMQNCACICMCFYIHLCACELPCNVWMCITVQVYTRAQILEMANQMSSAVQ